MTDSTNEVITLLQIVERLTKVQLAIKELAARYDELKARVDVISQKARKAHPSVGDRSIVNMDEYRNGGK